MNYFFIGALDGVEASFTLGNGNDFSLDVWRVLV